MALNANDVSAGDTILAAHQNAIIDDIEQHSHDGVDTLGVLVPTQVTITPTGATVGLSIVQAFDGRAIVINSEATTDSVIQVYSRRGIYIEQDLTNGYGLYIIRNQNEAGISPLATFVEDHASSIQPVLQIQNDGSGEEIKFTNPITRYIILDPSDIQAGIAIASDDASAGWSLAATGTVQGIPIHLPPGAIITRFDFWAYGTDKAAVQTITADLRRNDLDANTEDDIAQVSLNWGDSEAASFKTGNDTTIGNATITDGYSYYISILGDDISLRIKGAKVSYTIVEPLP